MANGKVITGYSKPYVALYNPNDGQPTYTQGMPLARGVDVSLESESGDSVNFYADNITAESVGGVFTGATITLTVDGLKAAARKLIMGLPQEDSTITVGDKTVNVMDYDNRQQIPYVGIGFIVRFMENGVTTYTPYMLPKCAFNVDGLEAATQEEEIEFQTTELEATVMRDDSEFARWQRIAADQTTEADAEGVVKALLGIALTEEPANPANPDEGAQYQTKKGETV